MLFQGKSLREISEQDLVSLIGISSEDQSIDFKEYAYPPPPDSELTGLDQKEQARVKNKWKIDLCKDLVAFANASGGWLVCGMREKGGTAVELCGLGKDINPERECARLEQCANTGIEPTIPGLVFLPIRLQEVDKSVAIVIHIPRSFRWPHRVKENSKFFVRRSNRNDEMNIDELRAAFNLSEHMVESIKGFRKVRVDAIASPEHEDVPVFLVDGIRVILHSIPLSFSDPTSVVDLSPFNNQYPAQWTHQRYLNRGYFNLDGYVRPNANSQNRQNPMPGYIQVFRNGTIECVEIILPTDEIIPFHWIEDSVLQSLKDTLLIQTNLKVEPPLTLMLSLVGVKDFVFYVKEGQYVYQDVTHPFTPIKQSRVLIPDVIVESHENDPQIVLKPIFDILWNIGGWERSLSYDKDGNWIRKKR